MYDLYKFYRSLLKINIEKSFSYSVMLTGISFTLVLYNGYFLGLFFIATLNLLFVIKLIGNTPKKTNCREKRTFNERKKYPEKKDYNEKYYEEIIAKTLTKEEQNLVYSMKLVFNKTLKEIIEDSKIFSFDKKILNKEYKERAKTMHPDKGGNNIQFQYLIESRNTLEEYLKRNKN